MLSLIAPRSRLAPSPVEGAYSDPGAITLLIAIAGSVRSGWDRLVGSYWAGHRKGLRIQAMTSSTCLPYTHG